MAHGHYEISMNIETSAPNYPTANIMVSMDIADGELPWGDVNHDYQVNITDAISLMDFAIQLEEMTEEQYEQFDLSGDAQVDIMDIIILIEAILGGP